MCLVAESYGMISGCLMLSVSVTGQSTLRQLLSLPTMTTKATPTVPARFLLAMGLLPGGVA